MKKIILLLGLMSVMILNAKRVSDNFKSVSSPKSNVCTKEQLINNDTCDFDPSKELIVEQTQQVPENNKTKQKFEVLVEKTKASYYADKFDGRKTASGKVFKQSKATAAYNHLPFGSVIRVTNLRNGKSVIVEVNDRGHKTILGQRVDLSKSAIKSIAPNYDKRGVIDVKIEILSKPQNLI